MENDDIYDVNDFRKVNKKLTYLFDSDEEFHYALSSKKNVLHCFAENAI